MEQAYGGEAVITVSGNDESMRTGLETVLRCKKFLGRRLHIVKPGFSPLDDLTQNERDALHKEGFELVVHDVLDPSKIEQRMAAIFIGPDLQVTEAGMQKLYDNMKATHHRHSHFAVSSNLRFEGHDDWRNPQNWISAGAYGFLLVIMMLDIFRSLLNFTKYHRTCDLRSQTLTHTYPNKKYFTPRRWWMWLVRTGVSGVNDGGADVLQIVPARDGGWPFVFRTINQHSHMSLVSPRWGLYYWTYYFLFSWPWWSRFLPPMPGGHWYYQIATFLLYRDMTNGFWVWYYMMHLALVGICAGMYMSAPIHIITLAGQILLYPFYLAVSPIVFLIGRLRSGTRSWKKMTGRLSVSPHALRKDEGE